MRARILPNENDKKRFFDLQAPLRGLGVNFKSERKGGSHNLRSCDTPFSSKLSFRVKQRKESFEMKKSVLQNAELCEGLKRQSFRI